MSNTPLIAQLLVRVFDVDVFWEGSQGLRAKPSENWFHTERHDNGNEKVYWFGDRYLLVSHLTERKPSLL